MTSLKFLKCVSLYSCLVVLIFAFTVIIQSMTTTANAGAPILYSCENFGGSLQGPNNLFTINPSDGSDLTMVEMSLSGAPITRCNGLARDPTTDICWVMIQVDPSRFGNPPPDNRILGMINPDTGVITSVGFPGLPFASIAFDSSGTLFGVVGDQGGSGNPISPETLQTLSKTDATPTLVQTLGNGSEGEAIGFNPNDGLMYHLSGHEILNNPVTGKIFETINLGDMTVTNITITDDVNCAEEANALVHQSGSTFLQAIGGNFSLKELYSITDSGVCTFLGEMDHRTRGLAFDCGVEPPTGACCSGVDTCTILTEFTCSETNSDFYQGDGTVCQPNPCIPDSTDDCCSTHQSTGCDSSVCQDIVCAVDDLCCQSDWDSLCVQEAEELCGNECVEPPSGPVVIIPTMGQWGMIFASIILGIFAVFAIRRRIKS